MKTEAKAPEKCSVELKISLDADETKAIVKKVENAFMREAYVPGFRKGKVPLERIRKEFAQGIAQEVRQAAIRDNADKGVKEAKLEAIAVTNVKDFAHKDGTIEFTLIVDVKPEVKLPAYKGLKIAANDTKATDEQIAQRIKSLRAAYAKFEDAKEGASAAEGDFVQIDYSGELDGKNLAEVVPDQPVIGSGTGFWMQLEEGRFLPEIIDAVKGMKAGETKTGIKVKFDDSVAPEALKGKTPVYTVTLKSFRSRILPDDATLAADAKVESYEKLLETTRENIERVNTQQEEARRRNEAIELLLKKATFDVPQSQVAMIRDGMLKELAENMERSGVPVDYISKNSENILKDTTERAERQTRLYYILAEIAKAEGIKAEGKDEDIGEKTMEFVLANAKQ
ncbi:MAG: trigger factor [Kiritimatiellae bacterium]|nr:trigger factor [Kiritimatiellia bacterium]